MYSKIKKSSIKCLLKLGKIKACPHILIALITVFTGNSPILGAGVNQNLTSYNSNTSKELVDKTLAVVNNEPILRSDVRLLESRLAKTGMIDDLLLFENTAESLSKDSNAKLQFLINESLLDSEVKRHNLTVTMDRVDQEIRDIAKRNNLTKDGLIKAIEEQGINLSEYQSFMKSRIERQSLVEQEVTSKIRLSDEDILAFYTNEAGKSYRRSQEYTLAHIFFDPQNGGPKAALERAQKVFREIKQGANFDSALKSFTEEENPSPNGLLGNFKTGEFSTEMESAVKDLEEGAISDIVKSRTGYHIIKLISKRVISDPEFEKQKDKFRSLLMEKVFKRQFKVWLDLKREDTTITINK